MEITEIRTKGQLRPIFERIVQTERLHDTFYTVGEEIFGLNTLYNYLAKKSYKAYLVTLKGKMHTFGWFTDKEGYYVKYHNCFLGDKTASKKRRVEAAEIIVKKALKLPGINGVWGIVPDYFEKTQYFITKYSSIHKVIGHFPGGYVINGKDYGAKIYVYGETVV